MSKDKIETIATENDCNMLKNKLAGEKILAIYATGYPVSSVRILLHFRKLLAARAFYS